MQRHFVYIKKYDNNTIKKLESSLLLKLPYLELHIELHIE